MFKKTAHVVANKYALIYKKTKFDLAEMNGVVKCVATEINTQIIRYTYIIRYIFLTDFLTFGTIVSCIPTL